MLGTFTLTCIGCASNAYVTVAKEAAIGHVVGAFSWGLALTAAIYVTGGVSGGHVNPAVSLGLASVGKLEWRKLPHYFAGQYLGAFIGAVITYCVYYDPLTKVFGDNLQVSGPNATAGIFGTFPNENSSSGTCFLDQVVAVGFFLLLINAITDKKNMNCPKGLVPVAIGLCDLGLLVFAFGYNCGAPINPARDFAPRLLTLIAGWGPEVFSIRNYNYFWIPIVACHLGGVIGSWLYVLLIENHFPDEEYDLSEGEAMNRNGTIFLHTC
ncbi:water-specific aquaporin-like protein [Dinothrombium tinctorium]|uniref:Water-specific aquaporin-like protein n=1 Tax=Dinothrombium tinctorium TaxID=1965070 RepID=A0A3S3P4R6_9ACAR|nr:water-specific aquaporin-like protein [Dinothrombium tinctorium]